MEDDQSRCPKCGSCQQAASSSSSNAARSGLAYQLVRSRKQEVHQLKSKVMEMLQLVYAPDHPGGDRTCIRDELSVASQSLLQQIQLARQGVYEIEIPDRLPTGQYKPGFSAYLSRCCDVLLEK
ncbi:hypothetical protein FI667_g14497, partial [Globisporangium splendens]